MKYFIFTLKSKIKLLPIICAVLLIFMGGFYMISSNVKNSKINLEIYFEEDNPQNAMISTLINGTTSTKNNLIFSTSDDVAISKDKLSKGEIDILITVPTGFYQSILNSENKSAIVEFAPNISQIEKSIFTSIAENSAKTLSYAQANIYVSDSIADDKMYDRNQDLNRFFINTVLNREDNFEIVAKQGSENIVIIYLGLIVISMIFASSYGKEYENFYAHLKVRGKNLLLLIVSNIMANFIVFFVLSIIAYIRMTPQTNFVDILKILIINLFISAFLEFCTVVVGKSGMFLMLAIGVISIFSSGILIPRLPIFTSLSVTPINLIFIDNIFSWSLIAVYGAVLICLSNYKINKVKN